MICARFTAFAVSFGLLMLSMPNLGNAAWIGSVGKVQRVDAYASTDIVLVTLDNQPTGPIPPGCTSTSVFAINGAMPAERRQMLVSQLLSAQGRGVSVAIYWDNAGSCVAYSTSTIVPAIQRITSMP